MTRIDADIEALKEFREALVRYRHAQRQVTDRIGYEIEAVRASLAEKASRAQTQEQLEHIRLWQLRVDEEASVFRGAADGFRTLLEESVPRTEAHLAAVVVRLEAARGRQARSA